MLRRHWPRRSAQALQLAALVRVFFASEHEGFVISSSLQVVRYYGGTGCGDPVYDYGRLGRCGEERGQGSNVHGVGVVKLPIRQPQREDLDRLRLESEAHGLHLAYGSDGGLLAVALAHEIG